MITDGRRTHGLDKISTADTLWPRTDSLASIFRRVTGTEMQVGTARHPELPSEDDYNLK